MSDRPTGGPAPSVHPHVPGTGTIPEGLLRTGRLLSLLGERQQRLNQSEEYCSEQHYELGCHVGISDVARNRSQATVASPSVVYESWFS
jgi:hypothetical protein